MLVWERVVILMKKLILTVLCVTVIMTMFGVHSVVCAETSVNTNIIDKYDFDDYSDLNGFLAVNGDNWKFGLAANTAATVETDVVSGSKALKFTSPNNQTSGSNITYVFNSALTTGITKISFDIRFANHSIQIERLGQLFENSGFSGEIPVLWKRVGEVLSTITTGIRSLTTTHWIDTITNSNKYYTIEQIWNSDTKILTYNIIKDGKVVGTGTKTGGETTGFVSVGLMAFVFKSVPASNGTATGDAVYYIDNFVVEKFALSVLSATTENKCDVDIYEEPLVNFNYNIDSESFKMEYIKVYMDDQAVSSDLYNAIADGNKIIISFADGMEYNNLYKIEILKGIKSSVENCIPMGENYIFSYTTNRLYPTVNNLSDGGMYEKTAPALPQVQNVELEAILIDESGNESNFVSNTMIDKLGKYTLVITGRNVLNNKIQKDIYNFEIIGALMPAAQNVHIEAMGNIREGSILNGCYTYYDFNGDEEGESIYSWYSSENKESGYTLVENDGKSTYKIQAADINKYFKFCVTPISKKEPYRGEQTMSEPFAGAFLPKAKNVTILGDVKLNEIITGSYEYYDENGEAETGTQFAWYRSINEGVDYAKIENADKKEYTISETDIDCLIRFCIIPCKSDLSGKEFFSDSIYGLAKPVVKDVKVVGSPSVGQTICGLYNYYDVNGGAEGATVVRWYLENQIISSTSSVFLEDSYAGKTLCFEVIPISKEYPFEGVKVRSKTVYIKPNAVKNSGSKSSGSSPTAVNKTGTQVTQPSSDVGKNPKTSDAVFSDIATHWAKETIEGLFKKGIINGIDKDKFAPDSNITRAQIGAIISRAFKLEIKEEIYFEDVDTSQWYFPYIEKVASNGIMNGYENNFSPNDYITRQELCMVIFNVAKKIHNSNITNTKLDFDDKEQIAEWAVEAVQFGFENGIIKGKGENKFCPFDYATRAEAIVMIDRLISLLEVHGNE